MTKTREQHQHHFARSVLRWLQAGYPDGVPAPDRLPLVALLRSTPLTAEQVQDVVRTITAAEGAPKDAAHPIERDEISHFISDLTHHDAGPENIARVASRLAAVGWPLAAIDVSEVVPGDEDAEVAEVMATGSIPTIP